jgi:hypothetical protein
MAVTEISLILMHDSSHVRKWNLQCLKQDDFFSGARSAVPNSLDSSNLLKRLERWFIFAFKSAARSLKKGFIFTFKRLYEPSLQGKYEPSLQGACGAQEATRVLSGLRTSTAAAANVCTGLFMTCSEPSEKHRIFRKETSHAAESCVSFSTNIPCGAVMCKETPQIFRTSDVSIVTLHTGTSPSDVPIRKGVVRAWRCT